MMFTDKELVFIERVIDNLSSEHVRGVHQYMDTISKMEPKLKKKAGEWMLKRFDDQVSTYDFLRTISTKCGDMRKKGGK